MNHWIAYQDFVELVRNHHGAGYSGLITGVSDQGHSFQVGFDHGRIALLSYRIKKGAAALELIAQIERARISEHPNSEFPAASGEVPETSRILSRLIGAMGGAELVRPELSAVPEMPPSAITSTARKIDKKLRQAIEAAAVHHFGPIGAIICAEHLDDCNGDVRQVMLLIAQDAGLDEAEAQAFYQSVTSA